MATIRVFIEEDERMTVTAWPAGAEETSGSIFEVPAALLAEYNRVQGEWEEMQGRLLRAAGWAVEEPPGRTAPEHEPCLHRYVQLVKKVDGGNGETVARCVDCGEDQPIPVAMRQVRP